MIFFVEIYRTPRHAPKKYDTIKIKTKRRDPVTREKNEKKRILPHNASKINSKI